jgi:hypothetical protein
MIGYPNVVDNHVISNEVMPFFIRSSVKIKTDVVTQVTDYVTAKNTSDHYPVLSRYDLNGTILTSIHPLTLASAGMSVWPNPVKQVINLQSNVVYSDILFSFFDSKGNLVYESRLDRINPGKPYKIEIPELISGIYLLQMQTSGRRIIHRFMIN